MSGIDNPNSGSGSGNENPREKAVNEGRRRFLIVVGTILGGSQIIAIFSHKGGCSDKGGSETEKKESKKSEKSKAEIDFEEKLLKKHPDAVRDPGTSYVVCGPRVKHILNEPVVEFEMAGHQLVLKKGFAERLQAANEEMKKATGKQIIVFSSTRSNLKNGKSGENKQAGYAIFETPSSGPCSGAHVMGQAFDVLNFDEACDYLEKQGFEGGYPGLLKDPWHFFDPKTDIIPQLNGLERKARIAENMAYYRIWKLKKWLSGKMPW